MEKGNRIVYFDILRVAATFAVIILHITGQKWQVAPVGSFGWNAISAYNSLVQWAVPVFVMISGALFLGSDRSIGQIFRKNILRIITAFIFWALFYAVIMYIYGSGVKEALKGFLGGFFHMWFLFLIIGLYLLVPLLRLIVQNKKLMRYFLLLSFIFTFVIPLIIRIVSLFHGGAGSFLQETFDKFHIHFVVGHTFYFALGYYISTEDLSAATVKAIYVLGILSFPLTFFLTYFSSVYTGIPQTLFLENFSVTVMFEAAVIFVFAKRHFSGLSPRTLGAKTVSRLALWSFGAYLVHAFFIDLLDRTFGINPLSLNPIISVPAIFIIVTALSFLVSGLLNQIPFLKKYIV